MIVTCVIASISALTAFIVGTIWGRRCCIRQIQEDTEYFLAGTCHHLKDDWGRGYLSGLRKAARIIGAREPTE